MAEHSNPGEALAEAVRGVLRLVDNIAMDGEPAEVDADAAATLWETENRLRAALALFEEAAR